MTKRFWTWAAAITAAAFLLRTAGISRHALDLDELLQYYIACRPDSLRDLLPLLRGMPLHAVLDPLLTYAMTKFSRELWWLRLQPVLLGTACVPALIALSRRFGAEAALLAGGLLAISVHHIEFSGFVDFYPFLVLWALSSTYALLRAAESGRSAEFAIYAAAMTGFLYTHPWAVLLMGFHGAWLLIYRRRHARSFLFAVLAAGLVFLPWFLFAASRPFVDPSLRYAFPRTEPLIALWATLSCWAGEPERGFYQMAPFKPWLLFAAPLYAALAALGLGKTTRERNWNPDLVLIALIAFGGMPAVFLADLAFGYDYAPRQVLFALPFFLVFVAEGLLALRKLLPVAALILCVLAWGANREMSRQLAYISDDLARIADRMKNAAAGRTLLFDEPNHAARVLFYLDRPAVLRLDPPVRFENVYSLGVPEDLRAAGGLVETIWRPHETPEAESRRWAGLARKIESGEITSETSDFGFMRRIAINKTMAFRERHADSFHEVRRARRTGSK